MREQTFTQLQKVLLFFFFSKLWDTENYQTRCEQMTPENPTFPPPPPSHPPYIFSFKKLSAVITDYQKYILEDYFINTFDHFNFLLLSTSLSSNSSVGCSFSVNLCWGPDSENLKSSLLITDFETTVVFQGYSWLSKLPSINDAMWFFNSLHFSFVVSLLSISKMLVPDGYKEHKERITSGQECSSLYLL